MKSINFIYLALFCISQIGFSQTEKQLHGKVLSDDFPLQGVKVINLNTEKSSITNNNGDFLISTKPNDILVFYELEYQYKRKQITEKEIYDDYIIVRMDKKPIELKEVVIEKPKFAAPIFSQVAADQINIEKTANQPKVLGVYDGSITNGMDFVRMFKDVAKLFKKKKQKKSKEKLEFKQIIEEKIDQSFFIKALELKPEQIALFLEFCDADPKSKTVLDDTNILSIMDFMILKNKEFKKELEIEK
jgi:transcription antitermination factor NusG